MYAIVQQCPKHGFNHKLEAIYKNMFLYDTHYPMIPFQGDNNHMQILHIMNSL